MTYNKNSEFEKHPKECPRRCGECVFFKEEISMKYGGVCTANNGRSHTYDFSNPTNRPLPMPLNCPWWYINNIWDKVSPIKIEGYREERLHLITQRIILDNLTGKDRDDFIDHVFRQNGYGLIDFAKYPIARIIYEEIKRKDGGERI